MKKLIFILLTGFTIAHAMQEISREPKRTKYNVPLTKLAVKEAINALLEVYKRNPDNVMSELYERDPNRISYLNDEVAHLLKEEVCLRLNNPLRAFKSTNRVKMHPQFNSDGELIVIAFGDGDKSVQLWSARTGKLLRVFNHDYGTYLAQLSPDGKLLVTGCGDETTKIWNVETRELLQTFQHKGFVNSADFSSDSKLLVITASGDGIAKVWNVETGALVQAFQNINVETGADLQAFQNTNGLNMDFAQLSPDSTLLATVSQLSHTIKLWDMKTGLCLQKTFPHSTAMNSIQFSSDNKFIVTASWDTTAKLWDVATGELLHSFEHNGWIRSARFSSDNKLIVTASDDKTVKLWDVETRECLHTFNHSSYYVWSAQFSPDGKLLATASGDEVRLWYIKPKAIKDSLELVASSVY